MKKRQSAFLSSVTIKNFKAVRDSKQVKLSPLTVLIGNNGSGKSSLVEALSTYQTMVLAGIDNAFQNWRGFEHIRNKAAKIYKASSDNSSSKPIGFYLHGNIGVNKFKTTTIVNERNNQDEIFFEKDDLVFGGTTLTRKNPNQVHIETPPHGHFTGQDSLLIVNPYETSGRFEPDFFNYVGSWQFLSLNPPVMGIPRPKTLTKSKITLLPDGSNIGEYLIDIRDNTENGTDVLNGIIETLQYVLPYAADLQPSITNELEKTVYLQLKEKNFEIPGWLLSTGTLRILALLAVLRHPNPPPLILIEELENGLDPRTINLLVDEILSVTESGRIQVIVTTHSPYLLDFVPLSTIVFVERQDGGAPVFSRPYTEKEKLDWAKSFRPGQLYTMSRLSPAVKISKGDRA